MQAHRLNVTIEEDHQLQVALPGDFPLGPAEVIVLAESSRARNVIRLGGALGPQEPPPNGDDPIAQALSELRSEREERLGGRAESLDAE